MRAVIPPVEASDQVHVARIRCPNAEDCPLDAVGVENMGTHLVVDPIMAALVEQVIILFTKKGNIVTNRRSFCCGQWAHVESLMGCGEVSRLGHGVQPCRQDLPIPRALPRDGKRCRSVLNLSSRQKSSLVESPVGAMPY